MGIMFFVGVQERNGLLSCLIKSGKRIELYVSAATVNEFNRALQHGMCVH